MQLIYSIDENLLSTKYLFVSRDKNILFVFHESDKSF